jgi:hypothetical protein
VGDRAAFTRHTHELLANTELARQLGEAGRRRMLTEFSIERMLERHVGLYEELVGDRGLGKGDRKQETGDRQ